MTEKPLSVFALCEVFVLGATATLYSMESLRSERNKLIRSVFRHVSKATNEQQAYVAEYHDIWLIVTHAVCRVCWLLPGGMVCNNT